MRVAVHRRMDCHGTHGPIGDNFPYSIVRDHLLASNFNRSKSNSQDERWQPSGPQWASRALVVYLRECYRRPYSRIERTTTKKVPLCS